MDHLLKEELDLIKDQNEEIIESLQLIKEKLEIKEDIDEELNELTKDEEKLDF